MFYGFQKNIPNFNLLDRVSNIETFSIQKCDVSIQSISFIWNTNERGRKSKSFYCITIRNALYFNQSLFPKPFYNSNYAFRCWCCCCRYFRFELFFLVPFSNPHVWISASPTIKQNNTTIKCWISSCEFCVFLIGFRLFHSFVVWFSFSFMFIIFFLHVHVHGVFFLSFLFGFALS